MLLGLGVLRGQVLSVITDGEEKRAPKTFSRLSTWESTRARLD